MPIAYHQYSLRVPYTSVNRWSFTGVRVTASLFLPSQYFDRSQQCCSLNGLDSSYDFRLFWSPFQPFWGPVRLQLVSLSPQMFHSFLSSLARSKYLSLISISLIFTLWFVGTTMSSIQKICCIAVIHIQRYTYTCGNIINNNERTNTVL